MSSPTTKQRAPLIGRRPERESTTGALIGYQVEGFKFTSVFVLLYRDTADERGPAQNMVIASPPPAVIL